MSIIKKLRKRAKEPLTLDQWESFYEICYQVQEENLSQEQLLERFLKEGILYKMVYRGEKQFKREAFQYLEYRRDHIPSKLQRRLEGLLSQRQEVKIRNNQDIFVDPCDPTEWLHKEMWIRARCLQLIEAHDDCSWWEEGFKETETPEPDLPTEGWLLVENEKIVGMAKFSMVIMLVAVGPTAASLPLGYHWVWSFAYVDPEHQRKGYTSRRLAGWIERYGNFYLEIPNEPARRMIKKAGYEEILKIWDHSSLRGEGFGVALSTANPGACSSALEFYEAVQVERKNFELTYANLQQGWKRLIS